jgi:DNA invertase Pin-like site-specific DNA recombinase
MAYSGAYVNISGMAGASRVFSYGRVSSARQAAKGVGLDRQDDMATAWCRARNLTLDTSLVLSDRGKSAYKGRHIEKGGALGKFLDLAQAGSLGPSPILLVEAIDRLSRLEPLDGLQKVVFALIEAGVTIITLEDEAEYSRDRLASDHTCLVVLVVKIQAAHEYSRRLSRRSTDAWTRTRKRLEEGGIARPAVFKPAWCDYSEETGFTLNPLAEVIRDAVRAVRHDGVYTVAKALNERKAPSPSGRPWSFGMVNRLVHQTDAVYGAVRLNANRRGQIARRERDARGLSEQVIENVLPVLVPLQELQEIRALSSSRAKNPEMTGPNGEMLYIGKGLTYCVCGERAGMTTGGTPPKRYRYIRCMHRVSHVSGCRGPGYRVRELHAHLLVRFKPAQLRALLEQEDGRDSKVLSEVTAVTELEGQLAVLKQDKANMRKAYTAAAKAARHEEALAALAEGLAENQEQIEDVSGALSAARARLAALETPRSIDDFDEPLRALMAAFVDEADTPEQRRAVNAGLRRMGVRITLHNERREVGLSIDGGPTVWGAFSDADLLALEHGDWGRRTQWKGDLLIDVEDDD